MRLVQKFIVETNESENAVRASKKSKTVRYTCEAIHTLKNKNKMPDSDENHLMQHNTDDSSIRCRKRREPSCIFRKQNWQGNKG